MISEKFTSLEIWCHYSPGFGTTTSNNSNLSLPQPFHNEPASRPPLNGMSHRNTLPSRNMHAEGMMRPSWSVIPDSDIDFTWTGGGTSPARMLVSPLPPPREVPSRRARDEWNDRDESRAVFAAFVKFLGWRKVCERARDNIFVGKGAFRGGQAGRTRK